MRLKNVDKDLNASILEQWFEIIPDGWQIKMLGQYVQRVKNYNSGLKEKNLLSLSYGKVRRRDIDSKDGLLPASFEGYNVIEKNDIVLRMTDLQNDQKSLRQGIADERGIITSAYITIRPSHINPSFLYYQLYAFDIQKGWYGLGNGIRQTVSYNTVKEIPLAVPSFSVQNRIANYLDEEVDRIDRLVHQIDASITNLNLYGKSLITEYVLGKHKQGNGLPSKGENSNETISKNENNYFYPGWLGFVPKTWKIERVGRALRYRKDIAGDRHVCYPRLALSKEGVVERAKYDGKGQSPADYNTYQIVPAGQFVFNLMGLEQDSDYRRVGIPRTTGLLSSGYVRMDVNDDVLYSQFGYYYFLMFENQRVFNAYGNGIRSTLNGKQLEQLPLLLPPLSEQREIASFLDNKMEKIGHIIHKKHRLIVDLKSYKDSLIYEVVTGKKRVLSDDD